MQGQQPASYSSSTTGATGSGSYDLPTSASNILGGQQQSQSQPGFIGSILQSISSIGAPSASPSTAGATGYGYTSPQAVSGQTYPTVGGGTGIPGARTLANLPFGTYILSTMARILSLVDFSLNWAAQYGGSRISILRDYASRYPPLAVFLFTFVLLAALPVGLFVLFTAVSATIVGTIALVGFAMVEGTMVAIAGSILLFCLAVISFFSVIGFGWVALMYTGYRVVANIYNQYLNSGMIGSSFLQGLSSLASMTTQGISKAMPSVSSMTGQQPSTSSYFTGQSNPSNVPASSSQPRSFY